MKGTNVIYVNHDTMKEAVALYLGIPGSIDSQQHYRLGPFSPKNFVSLVSQSEKDLFKITIDERGADDLTHFEEKK